MRPGSATQRAFKFANRDAASPFVRAVLILLSRRGTRRETRRGSLRDPDGHSESDSDSDSESDSHWQRLRERERERGE